METRQPSLSIYTSGCNGDLLYEVSSGECVETCSCAFSIGGSCQPFDTLGKSLVNY